VKRLVGERGTLFGLDCGEFDGGLFEYNCDGNFVTEHQCGDLVPAPKLIAEDDKDRFTYEAENVLGMHRIGSKVIVFRGLNHRLDSGHVEIYEGEIGLGLRLVKKINLGTAAYANGIHSGERFLAAGDKEVFEIDSATGSVTPIRVRPQQELRAEKYGSYDPAIQNQPDKWHVRLTTSEAGLSLSNSSSIVGDGRAIYLGGRGFVTKLVPVEGEYQASWLVHPSEVSLVEEVRNFTVTGENYDQLAARFGLDEFDCSKTIV
jgi:hypothetical protein